ncbi:hypothetical protein Tco_0904186 [Tanacetum coccineum]
MVQSMMNLTTLLLSFWDYALESTIRILNMVPTKKVGKTPYELCGRAVKLKQIQAEDTSPFKNISEITVDVEAFEPPQEEVVPVHRSKGLIGLSQSSYMDKILKRFKMDNSKRGNILMQERLDLNKTQGASTPEEAKQAEYIVASKAAMKVVWIRKFISGLGIIPTINEPSKMFCDNLAALVIANEPGVQKGVTHYHKRYHYVHECIKLGEINLIKVHTDNNLADPFTKALPKGKLTQHARSI